MEMRDLLRGTGTSKGGGGASRGNTKEEMKAGYKNPPKDLATTSRTLRTIQVKLEILVM